MITQQVFASVIDSQRDVFEQKNAGVERELLHKIPFETGFASIITGLRRCGKSTLLMQVIKRHFSNEGMFLNFEDPRLAAIEMGDFERLHSEILERNTKVLFFDEIQIAKGWEIFVNQLLRDGFVVFVTGSNASLLSKELGTHLTGRHFSTELFPFSFSEFLKFKGLERNVGSFIEFSQIGGMPDYLRTGFNQYLNDLLNDILLRDIAIRYGIRDVRSIKQLAVYLLSNIGSLVTGNSLVDLFGVKSTNTILEYFSHLSDAYLIEFIPLFDYSIKKQVRNPQKCYSIDLGLHHQNKISFSANQCRVLENMVYLHLRGKNKEIYYFQNKGECDFVVAPKGSPKELYQVCTEINNSNVDRETKGLLEAMELFGIKSGYIITQNQTDIFRKGDFTIKALPAWQWMSD